MFTERWMHKENMVHIYIQWNIVYLIARLCPTLCDPMDCSTPGYPVPQHLLEFAQDHVQTISDTIQPSHPLSPSCASAFSLSQHQGLYQWVDSSHQVAKVLELQLLIQSFQWVFRVDLLQDWLAWSPCCPRASPGPQFKSITFSALSTLNCTWLLERP